MARVGHKIPGTEDLDIPELKLTPSSTDYREHKR